MKKDKKEKTSKKKTIQGKFHACQFGPTSDDKYLKCYFCPNIKLK